jgi:hypothetical protein
MTSVTCTTLDMEKAIGGLQIAAWHSFTLPLCCYRRATIAARHCPFAVLNHTCNSFRMIVVLHILRLQICCSLVPL